MAQINNWPNAGNPEGITELKLIRADVALNIQYQDTATDTSAWLDAEPAPFVGLSTQVVDIKGAMQEFSYSQAETQTNQGLLFNWQIEANLPFVNKNSDSILAWIAASPMVALLRMASGQCRLVGTAEFPLLLNYTSDTAGYRLTLSGSSPMPALNIASTLLANLGIASTGNIYEAW
jgi:hypothetical protein